MALSSRFISSAVTCHAVSVSGIISLTLILGVRIRKHVGSNTIATEFKGDVMSFPSLSKRISPLLYRNELPLFTYFMLRHVGSRQIRWHPYILSLSSFGDTHSVLQIIVLCFVLHVTSERISFMFTCSYCNKLLCFSSSPGPA